MSKNPFKFQANFQANARPVFYKLFSAHRLMYREVNKYIHNKPLIEPRLSPMAMYDQKIRFRDEY
jgi:hypothetical protein